MGISSRHWRAHLLDWAVSLTADWIEHPVPLPTVTVVRTRTGPPSIAVAPPNDRLAQAVADAGATVVDPADAEALVWAVPHSPSDLADLLATHRHIAWVQLPFAGVDAFANVLDHDRTWTSAKGAYDEPVAEMALALLLATRRHVVGYATETSWTDDHGEMLFGARVVVLGGGAIARVFIDLLTPFGCDVTVVRRSPDPVEGATVVTMHDLDEVMDGADAVVAALALTPETEGILDRRVMQLLAPGAVIVNIARGAHVVTDDLVALLESGHLAGAGLDVTDPEPLPDGHPLWRMSNVVITPHVGNTRAMGRRMLTARLHDNIARFAAGEPLVGAVDVDAGY